MQNKNIFNSIFACIGTFLTWLFGGWDIALQILIIFLIIDYITGTVSAGIHGELNSKVMRKKLVKKSMMIVVLIVAVLLDRLLKQEWIFRTVTIYFFIGNEGLSILENVAKCGVPLPDKLIDMLSQLKKEVI